MFISNFRAPDNIAITDYDNVNITAIRIFWNISTSFVNRYIITIAGNNLPTITHQVNNESVRELGLLRERDEVRGYYDLLGALRSVTARML